MGLFTRKQQDGTFHLGPSVGYTSCVVSGDGAVYINQQHHVRMEADVVAAVAAVTWGTWSAAITQVRGDSAAADAVLHQLTSEADAEELNSRVNPGGLISVNPPTTLNPEGPTAWAEIRLLADGDPTASWTGIENLQSKDVSLRAYAGFWLVADRHGHGSTVRHALRSLIGSEQLRNIMTNNSLFTQTMPLLERGEHLAKQDPGPIPSDGQQTPRSARDMPSAPSEDGDTARDNSANLDSDAGRRLAKSLAAINDLLAAGTVTSDEAADMRDRAMARYEHGDPE